MVPRPGDGLNRALEAWGRVLAQRPGWVLLAAALLTLVSGWRAATALRPNTARLELIGRDVEFVGRFEALEREYGDLDAIVVVLEGDRPERIRACARALEARVAADTERFSGVFCRVDPAAMGGRALLWTGPEPLGQAADAVGRLTPGVLRQGPLPGLLEGLAGELRTVSSGSGTRGESPPGAERFGAALEGLLQEIEHALAGQEPSADPLGDPLGMHDQGWAWAGTDERTLVMLVAGRDLPGELDPKGPSVAALRTMVDELRPAFPEVTVGVTGKPVLQVDEMSTYMRSSFRASLVSLLGVTLLQIVGLRRLLAPLLIGGCMVLAVIWTMGAASVWPGSLNLLATVFVVIVIGLGDDYGIHLVTRYDWERAKGLAPAEALSAVLASTGSAIGVAGLTTVLAFAACFASEFRGLREFGAVAGCGVLAAALVSVSVLPALLVLLDSRRVAAAGKAEPRPTQLDRALGGLDRLSSRRPLVPLGLVALLALLAAVPLAQGKLTWDPSLIRLQDPSLPSVKLELRMLDEDRFTSWFMAWPAPDLARLEAAAAAVRARPEVERVESVLDVLPRDQDRAVPALARLQAALRPLVQAPPLPALEPERLSAGLRALEDASEELGDAALAAGHAAAVARLSSWAERAARAREALAKGGPGTALVLDARIGQSLRDLARRLSEPAAAPIGPRDLPPALQERLIGREGKHLLRIYPRGNMWNEAELETFVNGVQAALPEATGVPEVVLRSSQRMVAGYREAGLLALVLVTLCIAADFRAAGPTLLALLTLVLGTLWTAGLLAATGVTLNPANLVALPLLVGIGINAPVYVIHRAREAPDAILGMSLGRALIYAALTSVVGFGSLLLADHQGMASIGSTTSIGVLACLVAALLVPGPFLALFRPRV